MSNSTESRVKRALDQIEALLGEITSVRQSAEILLADLDKAKALYREKLFPLVEEGDTLRFNIATLQARRLRKTAAPVVVPDPDVKIRIEPPKSVLPERSTEPPPPPPRNPRRERKLALADHISWVMGRRRQEAVIKVVNALLADENADVGDMLELIAWGEEGEFWKARPDWQTLEDHAAQLEEWVSVLEGRLAFWRAKVAELEDEKQLPPWPNLMTNDSDQLRAFLETEMQQKTEENRELARQAGELEKMIQGDQGN